MSTAVQIDTVNIEREALKFFLASVKKELNNEFSFFYASVSNSGQIPQLQIREGKGKGER